MEREIQRYNNKKIEKADSNKAAKLFILAGDYKSYRVVFL